MAEAMLAQARSYEGLREMARDYERSREITSVYGCWADCLKQDLQDFFGIFGMAGVPLT